MDNTHTHITHPPTDTTHTCKSQSLSPSIWQYRPPSTSKRMCITRTCTTHIRPHTHPQTQHTHLHITYPLTNTTHTHVQNDDHDSTCDRSLFNDECVCSHHDVAVHVGPKINLYHVTNLEERVLCAVRCGMGVGEGWEVKGDVERKGQSVRSRVVEG